MMTRQYGDSDIDQLELTERELTRIAAKHSMTVEEAFLAWQRGIAAIEDDGLERVYHPSDDPLHDFLGAGTSDVPDLAERHDDHLGQGYRETHDDGE